MNCEQERIWVQHANSSGGEEHFVVEEKSVNDQKLEESSNWRLRWKVRSSKEFQYHSLAQYLYWMWCLSKIVEKTHTAASYNVFSAVVASGIGRNCTEKRLQFFSSTSRIWRQLKCNIVWMYGGFLKAVFLVVVSPARYVPPNCLLVKNGLLKAARTLHATLRPYRHRLGWITECQIGSFGRYKHSPYVSKYLNG